MFEDMIGILFLLVGAMMVALVWLFVDVRDYKHRFRDLEEERVISDRARNELWHEFDKLGERIAKMDATIHEKLIHDGPEVKTDEAD